jgi:hypothetical protein
MLSRNGVRQRRDRRKELLGINVVLQELAIYGRLELFWWEVHKWTTGSSERYAHMNSCEICKVIMKLGLPRAVHDL